MSRILFQRAPEGFRTVRGDLVRTLQASLEAKGFDVGTTDGILGGGTEAALRLWQQSAGRPATGKVDEETWKALVSTELPPIFDRCLQVTAAFEGHGYGLAVGNFDGAWLTWGIIGFTLRHGEVQAILEEVSRSHRTVFDAAFGALRGEMREVLDGGPARQEAWANSISLGTERRRIREDWKQAFARLGEAPEVRAIQRGRAEARYWMIARRDVERFGLRTEMGAALCFDIAVQNGGIEAGSEGPAIRRKLERNPPVTEQDVRVVIANVVAEDSNPRWIEDVRSRKLAIAMGSGRVHGARYAVKTWGLDELPHGI